MATVVIRESFGPMQMTSNTRKRLSGIVSVLLAYACSHTASRAQDIPSPPILSSELGHENLSRVAASSADIKAVVVKDAGLMVEIKRWLARDATAHGQIISDSDLNDDAIFDRLETDIQFRSVATTLLQRYGYLVPTVNPNSQVAKEQDFLFRERTKLMAANQEAALAARRQQEIQRLQKLPSCGPQLDVDCNVAQAPGEERAPGFEHQKIPATGIPPGESSPPNIPRDSRENQMQLTQAEEESAGTFPQLPLGVAYLEGNGQLEDLLPLPAAEKQNLVDASSPYGVAAAWGNRTALDLPSPNQHELNPAAATGSSAVNPVQPQAPDLIRASSPYNEIPSLYDMNVQAIPRPALPGRFGAEVFKNGTRDAQLIPMDLPAGPDYVVGPGDGLSIDLWGGVSQRIYRVVDREGRVSLPEVG